MTGKVWLVEGKYTSEYGWEELETVTEEEGGMKEAQRLVREHQIAEPYGQHRYRPVRDTG